MLRFHFLIRIITVFIVKVNFRFTYKSNRKKRSDLKNNFEIFLCRKNNHFFLLRLLQISHICTKYNSDNFKNIQKSNSIKHLFPFQKQSFSIITPIIERSEFNIYTIWKNNPFEKKSIRFIRKYNGPSYISSEIWTFSLIILANNLKFFESIFLLNYFSIFLKIMLKFQKNFFAQIYFRKNILSNSKFKFSKLKKILHAF